MSDHVKFVALAKKLIAKHGRSISVTRKSQTPVDSNQPWRGNTADPAPLSCMGVDIKNVKADDENPTKRGGKIFLLAAGDDNLVGVDVKEFDVLTDGATVWRIKKADLVQPGDQQIIYTVEVEQ